MSVDHYENFPVASVLCPPALRPAVTAIYHYARTADDLADEGDAPAAARLADLAAYRADLAAVIAGRTPAPRWRHVFHPLGRAIADHALPPQLLQALLDAFEQDVRNPRYADRAALLDYCGRSANPVGRLLLHLYGVCDVVALRRSDAICSALQLINFWQDVGVDAARDRIYIPADALAAEELTHDDVAAQRDSPGMRRAIAGLVAWSRTMMADGAPLATTLPGRAGWELRFVVQGALRVAEKIAAMDHATLLARPTLRAADAPRVAWRALAMR